MRATIPQPLTAGEEAAKQHAQADLRNAHGATGQLTSVRRRDIIETLHSQRTRDTPTTATVVPGASARP